jgi:hypothetical protein
MEIQIELSGLFEKTKREAWQKEFKDKINLAVKKGMETSGKEITTEVREDLNRNMNIKKKSFLKSITSKVYSNKKDTLPAMQIYAKVGWLKAHEHGETIKGNLLIPILEQGQKRIGQKKFKQIINNLMDSGNAFIIRKNGYSVVMAENIKENSKDLSTFKKAERLRTGQKSVKKGKEIPIAVIVKSVKLKKRMNLTNITQKNIPNIAKNIENSFDFRD